MNNKIILITISSLFILTGCGGGGENSINVQSISNNATDSDAVVLENAPALSGNLNDLFGDADGEPKAVEDNDSVQDVIDRTGS